MSHDDEVKQLLIEIRDNQSEALRRQDEHLQIAREQLDRAKSQISESIDLQREAVAKARMVMRIAIPGILLCLALIVYLVVKYF
jgi:uncharacterized protein YdaT